MKNRKQVVAIVAFVLLALLVTSVKANTITNYYMAYLPLIYVAESTPIPSPTPEPTESPTPPPVSITGNVSITGIHYDGTGQNEPDEYVEIMNIDTNTIQLQGWNLKDNYGWTFTFPNFEMQPNQVCRIYTNEYHPESCGFSFGKGNGAIWNNTGDCGFLRDSEGTLISQRCY